VFWLISTWSVVQTVQCNVADSAISFDSNGILPAQPEVDLSKPEVEHSNLTTQHSGTDSTQIVKHGPSGGHSGPRIASWRWDEYRTKFIITLTVLLCSLFKILFHKMQFISRNVPESCLLILMGLLVGMVVAYTVETSVQPIFQTYSLSVSAYSTILPKLTPDLFFNLLLPPVILNSAFTLYDREFLSNLSSVLVFAVLGTLLNVIVIGLALYFLSTARLLGSACSCVKLTCVEAFVFSSLISAVDPVAVLAIFEDIHVNMSLYFLVFGESLLNDGVTIVLYNTMISLQGIEVGVAEVIIAIVSFLFVTMGGSLIGVLFGFATSLTTKYTKEVRVIEPVLVFSYCYLGFLITEMVHWSGIISIITYGLTVKRYAFNNISNKSYTTIKYGTLCMASTSDCIIFLFLGFVLFTEQQLIEVGFVVATILLCLVVRFVSTFLLSYLVNCRRNNKISTQEQLVMSYGGLRGAVGFSLAMVLDEDFVHRKLFITTALSMVFFTVFIQGSTIKPIVKWLKINLKTTNPKSMTMTIQEKLLSDVVGGIEAVVGSHGTFWWVHKFQLFEERHLKKFLLSKDATDKLARQLTHRMLDKHFTHLYAPTVIAKHDVTQREVDETTQTERRQKAFSHAEDLHAFSQGARDSEWGKFSHKYNKGEEAESAMVGGLVRELALRDKRFNTMQNRILSYQGHHVEPEDEGSPVLIRRNSVAPHVYNEYRKTQKIKRDRLNSGSSRPESPTSLRSGGTGDSVVVAVPATAPVQASGRTNPFTYSTPTKLNNGTRNPRGLPRSSIDVIHETKC